jgi:hypothetical protein
VILDHHNKAAPNAMSGGQGSTDNIAI